MPNSHRAPETSAAGLAELRPLQIEANGINVITDAERKGHPRDLFWPWFAANISVLGLSYGSFELGFGISFWQAVGAGLVGIIVSFLLCGFIAVAGKRGSAPTMVLSRAAFGVRGNKLPAAISWLLTVGWETVLIILATGTIGEPRAALLGLAAACGYALTAALIKSAMADLGGGAVEFFGNWHIYAAAAAGVVSLFLLQNALLTVGDALISIALGVTLFNEELRGGWWLLPQVVALALIIVGCVQIAKSPLAADPGGLVSESASTVQLSCEQAGRPRTCHYGSPLADGFSADRQTGQ